MAAAINPVDYKIPKIPIMGWMKKGKPVGLDMAGLVVECGSSVTDFKVGDEVFGNAQGTLAEFAACNTQHIAIKPKNLSFVEAASLPTAGLTSYQALTKHKLKQGDKLLVLGASGGCGIIGVQVGKILGAHVTGVCGARNVGFVKELGADTVIDYTQQDFSEVIEPHSLDMVYDTVTSGDACDPDYEPQGRTVLKPGAMYCAINANASDWIRKFTIGARKHYDLLLTTHSGEDLAVLAKWCQEGQLKPVIAQQVAFTWDNVKLLFEAQKSRRSVGKLVFNMQEQEQEQEQEGKAQAE
eukprot:CAMPEP_0175131498 /NCGR_PEP_ID=MMETSP0087-20121206/6574_1 /TAXON_ID=136419 /ORGANISM="Unknown Unknown, Strain D1" /LENGTH=296 /DNA_ID=CAMNT_0016413791 /DNA_START=121 /DNA_END=1011 /DNA_ORIENTATION=+